MMSSHLTPDDVRRLAALARLEITDAEVERLGGELGAILDYAAVVAEVNTTGVAPMSHVAAGGDTPGWRADEPAPSLDRSTALETAPDADRAAGLFRVPRVIG
jgi:aspartyl-tRNA(Asn)/glutamyl-tRNA(Gln) amidotransferase subunit C